jgi:SNF2 family DNA or RNA helicase
MNQLERIQRDDEKAILFTEFRDLQRMLQYRIRECFGFSPIIVNGSTKAGCEGGDRSRQALIDAFQARPGFGVIVLSTTAVGFGVNIQAANHVVHFTRAWNPAKEDQATDRAYRIGQAKTVYVYYPTVTAEDFQTFEARLDDLLARKRELASDMLNGAGEIDFTDWGDLVTPEDGSFA